MYNLFIDGPRSIYIYTGILAVFMKYKKKIKQYGYLTGRKNR